MDINVKALEKLIDILPNAIGRLFKAYFDRRDIDTKAYEIRELAKAYNEASKLTSGLEYKSENITIAPSKEIPQGTQQKALPDPSIEERALSRATFQEIKKQHNLENIVAFAVEDLKNKESVTDTPVDDDWLTRFFKIAEDVSTEEMQFYWGRILAGEITRPGSFSLRTLDIFKNISKEEAEVFAKVANLAFMSGGRNFVFHNSLKGSFILDGFGIERLDISTLIEIGLVLPGDFTNFIIYQKGHDSEEILLFGTIAVVLHIKANTENIIIYSFNFTNSGNELLRLIDHTPPPEYLKTFSKLVKNEKVKILYATDFIVVDGHVQTHGPLKEFEFDEDPLQE